MQEKLNILLIVVDALRADHLGCYGYQRPTSPHIDRLADEGGLVERFFCSAIPTQPSFTTLYTGQHPITHGIVTHAGKAELAREAPFLPELFLEAGYATCAVDNLLRARLWFSRGYEFYIDPSVRRTLLLGVACEELNARAIPWLQMHVDEPFFLLVHYWDPHYPLAPPTRFHELFYEGNATDPKNHSLDDWWKHPLGAMARDTWARTADGPITDPEYLVALYDQEIRYVDEGIGNLLSALDELGLTQNTLVMLTADHGASLTEHSIFVEHHGLYDPTVHVPLITRLPESIPAGVQVTEMFQMEDIAPTLLEAAGLPIPKSMDGRSFWRRLTSEEQTGGRERVLSLECSWQAKWSLRTDRYKFILAREPDFYGSPSRELYDLATDPEEEQNIAEECPEITATMEDELEDWITARLQILGKEKDPLREQGTSLAQAWKAYGGAV